MFSGDTSATSLIDHEKFLIFFRWIFWDSVAFYNHIVVPYNIPLYLQ
jgi:hypothetical protein